MKAIFGLIVLAVVLVSGLAFVSIVVPEAGTCDGPPTTSYFGAGPGGRP